MLNLMSGDEVFDALLPIELEIEEGAYLDVEELAEFRAHFQAISDLVNKVEHAYIARGGQSSKHRHEAQFRFPDALLAAAARMTAHSNSIVGRVGLVVMAMAVARGADETMALRTMADYEKGTAFNITRLEKDLKDLEIRSSITLAFQVMVKGNFTPIHYPGLIQTSQNGAYAERAAQKRRDIEDLKISLAEFSITAGALVERGSLIAKRMHDFAVLNLHEVARFSVYEYRELVLNALVKADALEVYPGATSLIYKSYRQVSRQIGGLIYDNLGRTDCADLTAALIHFVSIDAHLIAYQSHDPKLQKFALNALDEHLRLLGWFDPAGKLQVLEDLCRGYRRDPACSSEEASGLKKLMDLVNAQLIQNVMETRPTRPRTDYGSVRQKLLASVSEHCLKRRNPAFSAPNLIE